MNYENLLISAKLLVEFCYEAGIESEYILGAIEKDNLPLLGATASRMAKNLSEKCLKLADGAMKIHIQLEEMNNKDAEH